MKKYLLCLLLLVCWAGLANAGKFDCVNLPFGKDLNDFNQENHFIKYKEKSGIAYYNYAGTCVIEQQKRINIAIAYGFVDNKLYARYITVPNNADAHADKELIVKNITAKLGAKPKAYEDGDWYVVEWDMPGKQLKYKMKFNMKTNMSKSVYYYTPLRPKEAGDELASEGQ